MFFTHVCESKLMGATTANVRAIIFISYSTLRGRHNHTIYSKTQKKKQNIFDNPIQKLQPCQHN